MIVDRYPVTTEFKKLQHNDLDSNCAGRELTPKPVGTHRRRILLVEDQDCLRAPLRMMLEFDGYQVVEASNGAEALRLFTLGQFDLIITDFEMPVMGGSELAAAVKLLAPSLPILMITASETAPDEVENPVDALLSKPLMVRDLRCALGRLLSAGGGPPQPSAAQGAPVERPAAAAPKQTRRGRRHPDGACSPAASQQRALAAAAV